MAVHPAGQQTKECGRKERGGGGFQDDSSGALGQAASMGSQPGGEGAEEPVDDRHGLLEFAKVGNLGNGE